MSKALVVDDSKTIRTIIRRILVGVGYEVLEAGDGVQALEVLAADRSAIRLVLADWNMPVMNGFELLKQIRQDPELTSLKVMMVTTETEMCQMTSALEAGANEYIMKPFTKDILMEKLELMGVTASVAG
jgi:two-component system chemotaxis response regulator CheY